jgi:hypothetical protein
MLDHACRAAHEPEAEALIPMISRARNGRIPVGDLRQFLHERDRRLGLDFEASHLLGGFVEHLVDAFPNARFMLLVRELRAWIDSMINNQLNLRSWEGYATWQLVFHQYLERRDRRFPAEESALRELDLYPLSHYIRYWHEEVDRIVDSVPADRLLVLGTEGLADHAQRIAEFVGVSPDHVAVERSHGYKAPAKHNVLDSLDQAYLEQMLVAPVAELQELAGSDRTDRRRSVRGGKTRRAQPSDRRR